MSCERYRVTGCENKKNKIESHQIYDNTKTTGNRIQKIKTIGNFIPHDVHTIISLEYFMM